MQPRSLSPAPLQQGSARNHVPVPFPSKGTWMEAAHKRLMSGPQRPPRRMEAWLRFKGALVLYNLSAGDNSQAANERRGAAPPLRGAWHHGYHGCQDPPRRGHGHLPGQSGRGGPPPAGPILHGDVLGVPQGGGRDCATLCPALEALAGCPPPAPGYACLSRPDVQRPQGPQHNQSEGTLGSASGVLFTPKTHGLGAPQPSIAEGSADMEELRGRGQLVPWVQGQRLAPDLGRVCLIPDKEATPGTWLANGCSPGNGTEGSANPPSTRRHPSQDRLFAHRQHRSGISQAHGSLWPPTLPWHSMAQGQRGSGHAGRARADGDVVQGKAGCPVLCQTQPDLRQGQPPSHPGPILPHRLPGHRAEQGAWDRGGGLAPWPCHTAST